MKNIITTFKIILNAPFRKDIFLHYFSISDILICADGGLNRLYHTFPNPIVREKFVPDYVVGDLDSVKSDILSYY